MFRRQARVARVVKIQSHHKICHVPYDRPTRVDLLEKYPHASEVYINRKISDALTMTQQ